MEGPEADAEVTETEEDVIADVGAIFGIRRPVAKLPVVLEELEDTEAETARIARSR